MRRGKKKTKILERGKISSGEKTAENLGKKYKKGKQIEKYKRLTEKLKKKG